MDEFDDEIEERVVTYDERLSSDNNDDEDDEDYVPPSSSRKNARLQYTMYLGYRKALLSKYATNIMISGPGDRENRDLPMGPRTTNMNLESPLLKLPREVRLIIYEHLFAGFTLSLVPSSDKQPECVYTPPSILRSPHFSGRYLRSKLQRARETPRFAEADQLPNRGPHMICRTCTAIRDEAVEVLASCTKVLTCPELPRTSSRHAEVSYTRRGGSDQVTFVNASSVLNTRFRGAIKGLCIGIQSVLIAQYSGFPNLQKVSIDGFLDVDTAIGWDVDDDDDDQAIDDDVDVDADPSDGDVVMQDASTADKDHEAPDPAFNTHGLWQIPSPFAYPNGGPSANGDGMFLSSAWQASSPAAPSSTLLWNADAFEHHEGRSNAAEFGSGPSSSHHEFASTLPPSASTAGPLDAAVAFDLAMANTDYHLDIQNSSSPASSSSAPAVAESSMHVPSTPNNNPPSSPPYTGLFPDQFLLMGEEFRSAITTNFDPPTTTPASSRFVDLFARSNGALGSDLNINALVEIGLRRAERRIARAEARRKARVAARVARQRAQLETIVLDETLDCWGIQRTGARPLKLHPEWARRWWFELVWLPKHREEVLRNAETQPNMVSDVMDKLKLGHVEYSTIWRLLRLDPMEVLDRLAIDPSSDAGRTLLRIMESDCAPQQHRASNDGDHASDLQSSSAKGKARTEPSQSGMREDKAQDQARLCIVPTTVIPPPPTNHPIPRPVLAVQQAFKLNRLHTDNSYLVATFNLTSGQLTNGLVGNDDLACIDVRPPEWLVDLPSGRRAIAAINEDEEMDESGDKKPKIVFPTDQVDETIRVDRNRLWPIVYPSDGTLDDLF